MAREESEIWQEIEKHLANEGIYSQLVSAAKRQLLRAGVPEKVKSPESLINEAAFSLFKQIQRGNEKYVEMDHSVEAFLKVLCKFIANKLSGSIQHWTQQKRDFKRSVSIESSQSKSVADFVSSLKLETNADAQLAFDELRARVEADIQATHLKPNEKDSLTELFRCQFIHSIGNQRELAGLLGISRGQVQRMQLRLKSLFDIIRLEHE